MSLFQTSVIKKYLNDISTELIDKKYKEFQAYFGNAERQENIRNSKEEEYQSGFINALFVNILGYTLNPEPNFNIVLEKKNVDDSKKADGAILKDNKVIAVIELKSTQTTDLDTVETQAFGYKNHNPKCQYIITSNFEKIRLYIQNAIDHLEFDLFNLTKEDFGLLWLCLVKDNILQDIPLKIKESSVLQEENVTKKLYNDYSKFRKEIFENIVNNNPEFDKLVLFKKTQKLLDRFLFIFFAEDRLLLPPNSISEIVKQWTTLKEDLDEYVPLYERFKKYFGYLNTGFKGKKYDVFAYNGGLFLPDDILDNIKIDDEILHQNTIQLSKYDFETDVDVNILGHIFEHSLSEIENVQAEIAGEKVDQQKTKRKKDGIFYTPKYITKYIVENTVGKLCEEKRIELGIIDEEYAKGRKNRKKDIVRALDDKLTTYRDWLIEITILDPACGSGAFLNQALEFLIQEHKKIDELKFQLLGGSIVFPDIEAKILENNIFGVDLNEESVEIAKLSLWLRTAQKGRKLTTLSNHIKCGNSLIDEPEIAGEKAFNWQNEFPEVFVKGGFDVVIGNPPYVGIQGIDWDSRRYYETIFSTATGRFDLYTLFIEKAMLLKKKNGSFSFIVPGKILNNKQFKQARKLICENHNVVVLKIDDKVFDEAQVDSVILLNNRISKNTKAIYRAFNFNINGKKLMSETKIESILNDNDYIFRLEINEDIETLIKKIELDTVPVKQIAEVKDGIVAGSIKDILFVKQKINENCQRLYFGKNLSRYYLGETDIWINYQPVEMMKEEVSRKGNKRPGLWMRDTKIFLREKILSRFVGKEIIAFYDNQNRYYEHTLHSTHVFDNRVNHKYLIGLYNSKLINFYYKKTNSQGGDIFPQVRISSVEKLPIKITSLENQNGIIEKVDSITEFTMLYENTKQNFYNYIQSKFGFEKTSSFSNWYKLEFKEFLQILYKSKVNVGLSEEAQWLEYFNEQKEKLTQFKYEIDKTNKEIDHMIFTLYSLTEAEIKLIEESN
jgi:type I restriction-modification system DNA methylase subunit